MALMAGFLPQMVVVAVFFLYPTWRICRRAGFPPALSLLILIPLLGWLIVLFVLAFATWSASQPDARQGSA